ncbi:uncharacterized protein LOC142768483 [Rhipicephalus microplus]|uniref:uncharacterized protein LOC142768483 n=1 Tax=Rhipicephalus microplus TaxID=6941 RepID=UPI003F6CA1FF
MAAVETMMLLIGLLVSFCSESFEAGGWTEAANPDTPKYLSLAHSAYTEQKGHIGEDFTFLVTQARWKIAPQPLYNYISGPVYNIGFIVFQNNRLLEKCIATIVVRPRSRLQRRGIVTKFWCR